MPLTRYFLGGGGALIALMFIADAYLPKLPATEALREEVLVIRIQSERRLPDRVVFVSTDLASDVAPR